ncbi:MAG: DUF2254 domain-containing protein [Usitatibacter sp.]
MRSLLVSIRSSLWFVPTLMVGGAIALAIALVETDRLFHFQWAEDYPLLFGAGAEGSRGMLSTIAGSMITVAGVTFSLTIAALVTASGQYTSRILRNFMRDVRNQVVLGSFVGIFTYCLVVLRTIRGGAEVTFVPSLAVFAALVLALVGIGVLVFFIHHIATSIQASTIVRRITDEAFEAMDHLFPEGSANEALDGEASDWGGGPYESIPSPAMGYVQSVDLAKALSIAQQHGALVRLEAQPGEFVAPSSVLMSVSCPSPLGEEAREKLCAAVAIRRFRTINEDLGFGLRQLVDIALKALSPGINDTTTAVMCIDHIGAVLARLAPRAMPTHHRSEDGRIRLVAPGPRFDTLADAAFDQIRASASGNAAALAAVMSAISRASAHTSDPARLRSLQLQATMVSELAESSIATEHDRAAVRHARGCVNTQGVADS